ncbi:MAG TPA: lactonase family protein [Vicinamibacteria bacterium]|nr:lactonase family protein [Vicinamibacteria bacterium]
MSLSSLSSRRFAVRAMVGALVVAAISAALGASATSVRGASWVYFGTYTGPKSQGIYVSTFDAATGALGPPRLAAESANPSFLALHPSRPLLYAVNEEDDFEGQRAGSVSAFAIEPATGTLKALGRASSRGAHPCHLAVDRSGRHVLVANYSGGNVASLPLRADGSLEAASSVVQHAGSSADAKRQKGPHAHMIEADPGNDFVLAADLGLDQVLVYRFDDDKGLLTPADPPHARVAPGSGPRHFAFSPDGRDLYVLNEMLITVTAFKHQGGRLTEYQTVPATAPGASITPADSGAEILVHPVGRFVYASLRGPDSLAVFARDAQSGRLTLVEHVASGGKTPRGFGIDPSGRWLLAAHQRSDQVVVFGIDAGTGRLEATGQTLEVGSPVSVAFFPPRATR